MQAYLYSKNWLIIIFNPFGFWVKRWSYAVEQLFVVNSNIAKNIQKYWKAYLFSRIFTRNLRPNSRATAGHGPVIVFVSASIGYTKISECSFKFHHTKTYSKFKRIQFNFEWEFKLNGLQTDRRKIRLKWTQWAFGNRHGYKGL